MRGKWSRRGFMGAGAAAALGLTPVLRATPERADVAIVGAGLSGLYAGLILAELGARVVILEADTRPGGRCLTADGWPRTPDLGGAQIGRTYARIRDVCRRLDVALAPGAHVNAGFSLVVDGQLIPAAEWPSSPLNRTEGAERDVLPHTLGGFYIEGRSPLRAADDWFRPEVAAAYDVSMAEWLRRQGASAEALRLVGVGQGGTPLERLAVLRNMQEATRARHEFDGLDREALRGMDNYEIAALVSFHVVGGTSRLTEAMAASLGERVRLAHRVTAIEQSATGCTLRCANGSVVSADFALAAVPFSVLRGIALEPALSGDQAEAVQRMTYGNQSQVWLRTRSPYWDKDGIEASMWTDGPFTMIRQQIEHDGSRELVSALAFGENSRRIDAMSEAERGAYAIAELERIRPAMRGELEFIGAHSWELAPYARGCSFQLLPGRVHAWTEAMGQPHGRVHFAGEHLRLLEVGMEAAMESGERSALAIAERLEG